MTYLQQMYAQLQETVRSNQAKEVAARNELEETKRKNRAAEAETYRHNAAYEAELNRSNLAQEALQNRKLEQERQALAETARANRQREAELHRSNVRSEELQQYQIESTAAANLRSYLEQSRHNKATESQAHEDALIRVHQTASQQNIQRQQLTQDKREWDESKGLRTSQIWENYSKTAFNASSAIRNVVNSVSSFIPGIGTFMKNTK